MSFLNIFLLLISISFLGFFYSSFKGFQGYHYKIQELKNLDTTALASANLIAKASSEMLLALKNSLVTSISFTSYGTDHIVDSYDQASMETKIQERLRLLENYFSNIDPNTNSSLIENIDYGLSFKADDSPSSQKTYEIKILHSDYLPLKERVGDPEYLPTLIDSNQKSSEINLIEQKASIINENYIRIEENTLKALVGLENSSIITKNPDVFQILVDLNGLNISSLANSLSISANY